MAFSIAFLNCYNLYEPGTHPTRGPRTSQRYRTKVAALADAIRGASGGQPPDLVGLCEVGSKRAGLDVADSIAPAAVPSQRFYRATWSGVPLGARSGAEPGLMLLFNPARFTLTGRRGKDKPNLNGRHKWLAVEVASGVSPADRFWVVVNHWASDFRRSADHAEGLRTASAREVGEFFTARAGSAEAAVLVGDFNCEPHARPFVGVPKTDRLYSVRERALVLRDKNQLFYMYNAMWRTTSEPDAYEDTLAPGHLPSRPLGTYAVDKGRQLDWRTWDHLLVSRRMLANGPASLRERTLRIVVPARRASDHCAFAAHFD